MKLLHVRRKYLPIDHIPWSNSAQNRTRSGPRGISWILGVECPTPHRHPPPMANLPSNFDCIGKNHLILPSLTIHFWRVWMGVLPPGNDFSGSKSNHWCAFWMIIDPEMWSFQMWGIYEFSIKVILPSDMGAVFFLHVGSFFYTSSG